METRALLAGVASSASSGWRKKRLAQSAILSERPQSGCCNHHVTNSCLALAGSADHLAGHSRVFLCLLLISCCHFWYHALRRSLLPMKFLLALSSLRAKKAAAGGALSLPPSSEASLLSGWAAGGSPSPAARSPDFCASLLRFCSPPRRPWASGSKRSPADLSGLPPSLSADGVVRSCAIAGSAPWAGSSFHLLLPSPASPVLAVGFTV